MLPTLDRNGDPISVDQWARLFGDPLYRKVARTKITDAANAAKSYDISTVWLGHDQNCGRGQPVVFETLTFADDNSLVSYYYASEAEAQEGHRATVLTVAATLSDPIVMDE